MKIFGEILKGIGILAIIFTVGYGIYQIKPVHDCVNNVFNIEQSETTTDEGNNETPDNGDNTETPEDGDTTETPEVENLTFVLTA